jgi:hypothetical protein
MIDLSRSRLRRRGGLGEEEDFSPISGVANLADAMLVFSCGLLVSLASYWNLDLGSVGEVMKNSEVKEVGQVQKMLDDLKAGGSVYRELGTVYQDPKSGKLYMLSQDAEKGAGGTKSSTTSATPVPATGPGPSPKP